MLGLLKIMEIKDFIQAEGYYLGTVVGNSMRPLLRERRDSVLIIPANHPLSLKKYQVILFKMNDNYVLHRIIRIKNNSYVTRGDNNHRVEDVSATQIYGILKGVYIKGRYIDCNSAFYNLYSRTIVKLNFFIRLRDALKTRGKSRVKEKS